MYEILKSLFTLKEVELKNRLVFAPTSLGLKEKEYIAKIVEIAKGGTALIVIGCNQKCLGGIQNHQGMHCI